MTIIDSRTSRPLPDVGLVLATSPNLLKGLIAHLLLPAFPVDVAEGAIPFNTYDRRVVSVLRAPDGSVSRISTEVKGDKFSCKEGALEAPLYDGDIRVYGDRNRAEMHKAKQVAGSLLIAREVAAATLLFDTAIFADTNKNRVTIAGGKEWDAAADAGKPLDDLTKALGFLIDRGYDPSQLTLILPSKAQRALSANAQFKARTIATPAYAQLGAAALPAIVPESVIAAVLGIKEVILARGTKDVAKKGQAASYSPIWDPEMCMLAYLGSNAEDDAGLGHTFTTTQGLDLSALNQATDLPSDPALYFKVDAYREEKLTADIIRARDCLDMKLTNTDAAVLISNILA